MTEFVTLPAELHVFRDRAHAAEVLRLVVASLPKDDVALWIDPQTDGTHSREFATHQSYLERRLSETKAQIPWWRRLGESAPRLSIADPLDVQAFCSFAYYSIDAEIRVWDWVRHSQVFDVTDNGTGGCYQLPDALYASLGPTLMRLGLPDGWPGFGHDGGDSQSPGD
jgi:hypothetical protein